MGRLQLPGPTPQTPEFLPANVPFELRLGMILKAGESGKSFVNSNLTYSQPKFNPSQEITPLFIVEFRALRTVDPVRLVPQVPVASTGICWFLSARSRKEEQSNFLTVDEIGRRQGD
jgi:hypothetical protein